MEKILSNRRVKSLLLMTVIGVVIGILRPFGMTAYPLYQSISYWVFTCYLGYAIYAPTITFANRKLESLMKKRWWRVAVGAFFASIFMTIAMPICTYLFLDIKVDLVNEFADMFPRILLIGSVISIISLVREELEKRSIALVETQNQLAESKHSQKVVEDAAYHEFMSQLPIEKRGELLCLEMDDHYINVYTDKGHHMVLMRFKDAISVLSNYPGLQTHRSWWVANDAIIKVEKDDRKLKLTLLNGMSVPVSRTYQKQVKEAGFSR
ncbi:MAG: LytTR family DNA-binding domain-containing protein [Aliiglaciecola sp.]